MVSPDMLNRSIHSPVFGKDNGILDSASAEGVFNTVGGLGETDKGEELFFSMSGASKKLMVARRPSGDIPKRHWLLYINN